VTRNGEGGESWRIDLGEFKLAPGAVSSVIEVETILTHYLSPYPTEILQAERQMVLYNGNHYFLSPYPTKSQTTKIKLSSGSLESYSKLKPTSHSDNTITYGPYENTPNKAVSKLQVHFENNSPFLTVSHLDRSIEVSHWAGIISVEEVVDVKHSGALLKGAFSRYEFQREPTNGISSVKSFRTKLPPTAQDIYYRDEIGNISTSNVRHTSGQVVAELRPRFPLFGGWKTHYVLGYAVPTQDYLFNDGNQFILRIPFIDHIFDNSVIDEAVIRVTLPEGATDVKLRLPYSITRERDEIRHTYLDTLGRTVIVLRKSNLVENHIQDFEVHYTFNRILMLQEPLLIVSALFLLCVMVIIYVRLDFSLTKNPVKESAHKVSGIVESLLRHQDRRSTIYGQYDQATVKFKSSKDSATYQATLKRLHSEHKQETQAIADLLTKMKNDGAPTDVQDKVAELQKLDKNLKDLLQQQSTLAEKLVSGKTNKQMYMDTDGGYNKRKEEIAAKMVAIINTL
jgi:oligosaccharyltransferase complex subunit alpha (ribophorin I)